MDGKTGADGRSGRLPIRIVVADDLERSRPTVFFRPLLALPHLVAVGIWGLAVAAVAVILWLALVLKGKAPRSLQAFVASYLRYAVHVGAYLYLAAGPYPRFGGGESYPVDVEIDASSRQPRGGVAARLVLAFPALALGAALGGGSWFAGSEWARSEDGDAAVWFGGLVLTAAFLTWFASLARGQVPRGLRDLVAYSIGYTAQVAGYVLLLTDRYPTSDPTRVLPHADLPSHPVRLELHDRLGRSRLTVFFRALLTIPHLIWLFLWSGLALGVVFVAWFVALATGRVPMSLHRFIGAWVRYAMHVAAFLSLVGAPFPGFAGAAGSYPVDLAIDPPALQPRAVTLFRGILAIPALLLAGAHAAVVAVVGVLAWFAALLTGRTPEGMRNLGAVGLRYAGQTCAYLFLLTDRYPYATPAVRDRERDEQLELPLEDLVGIEPV